MKAPYGLINLGLTTVLPTGPRMTGQNHERNLRTWDQDLQTEQVFAGHDYHLQNGLYATSPSGFGNFFFFFAF